MNQHEINRKNQIIQDFIRLTQFVYPYKHEHEVLELIDFQLSQDTFGNYYYIIGEKPTTMFTSHFDTVGYLKKKVNHIFDGDIIRTDGQTILGADDKAGVALMLNMMRNNVKGLYYFFIGEELGRVGSTCLSNQIEENPFVQNISKIISFDRKGVDSIITHQMGKRCTSDIFAKSLAKELNALESTFRYRLDDGGIFTDSFSFIDQISECTNISVGYYSQHTSNEYQSMIHLIKLGNALCHVNWENLPVKRKIEKIKKTQK
jgi:hypothetical protein